MRINKNEKWLFASPLLIVMPLLLLMRYRQINAIANVGSFNSYDSAGSAAVQQLSHTLKTTPTAKTVTVHYTINHSTHMPSQGYLEYNRQSKHLNECDTSFSSGCLPLTNTTEETIHKLAKEHGVINDIRE